METGNWKVGGAYLPEKLSADCWELPKLCHATTANTSRKRTKAILNLEVGKKQVTRTDGNKNSAANHKSNAGNSSTDISRISGSIRTDGIKDWTVVYEL